MQTIYLDISNKGVVQTVYAKQGEVGRKFLIVLTDSGVPYIPDESTLFSAWYDGTSGSGNYTAIGERSAFSVDGNKVVVELIVQMLVNDGNGVLSISMNEADGTELSTWNIPYMIEKKPGSESAEAEAYYTAFSEMAARVADSADRAEAAAKSFVIDTTLSVKGQSADAAATGEALKLKAPSADVLMFGAVGDGVTDDSEAIQRAFNSGLTVVFPAGKYKFKGITCNHSVDVIFENAEIVPIFRKEHVVDDPKRYSGVINRMFIFEDCEKVTMTGLKIAPEACDYEKAGAGVAKHNTESIAEFHRCTKVLISGWNVQNMNYWNRGNNGGEYYNRKGIIFTAIDSEVIVENCYFKNMAYDEWTWITYKDNLAGSKATFKNCHFQSAANTLSCVGILAHTATVVDCVFENINNYDKINDQYYTMANLLSLYGNFSNNIIKDCTVGGVCDFREGVWVFATYAKIDNNRMVNSRCNKFAAVSGQYVQITNNVATARTFCNSSCPLNGNILREEDEITKIRYVIENNVVEALDTELIHAEIVDIGIKAEKALVYIDFDETVEEGEEPAWKSSDSEIMCRNNRFFSNSTGKKNPNLVVIDVGRLIMHDNILYLGKRTEAESTYTAIQLSYAIVDGIEVDLVGNRVEKNTVSETATNPHVVYISSKYQNVKMNAFYNSVRNGELLLASGYRTGVLNLDGQGNVNLINGNNGPSGGDASLPTWEGGGY